MVGKELISMPLHGVLRHWRLAQVRNDCFWAVTALKLHHFRGVDADFDNAATTRYTHVPTWNRHSPTSASAHPLAALGSEPDSFHGGGVVLSPLAPLSSL